MGLPASAIHPLDLNSENIPFPEGGSRFTSSGIQYCVAMISAGWNGVEWTGLVGAELASGAVGGRMLDGMLHAECCCLVLPCVPLMLRKICQMRWYYCGNVFTTGNCKG